MFRARVLRISSLKAASKSARTIRGVNTETYNQRVEDLAARFNPEKDIFNRNAKSSFDLDKFLPSGEYNAKSIAMTKMRKVLAESRKRQKSFHAASGRLTEGLPGEILTFEANALLTRHRSKTSEGEVEQSKVDHLAQNMTRDLKKSHLEPFQEFQLEIEVLSSTGDGLAYSKEHDHVFVVPFSIPGDLVQVKTYPQTPNNMYTMTDFVQLLRPSPKREGVTPGCKYFATCSGCQLQMLPYQEQLQHKKNIVKRAFEHFSNLDPSLIPPVGDTVGSPLQYGYRTKLTPHYDGPKGRKAKNWTDETPPIGYSYRGRKAVLDIEQCPIGTPILNEGLTVERRKATENYRTRDTGVTILLRESTNRKFHSPTTEPKTTKDEVHSPRASNHSSTPYKEVAPSSSTETTDNSSFVIALEEPLNTELTWKGPFQPEITLTYPTHTDVKTYTSMHSALTTEYVGDFTFKSTANSFFQNNNSILPTFLNYVRQNCTAPARDDDAAASDPPIKYLLDAYCGSGLFAVSLSPLFSSVLGIDIDVNGVEAARMNAAANHIPNAGFIAADAGALFSDVPFPPAQSLVVIDPPRKGASVDFLTQLCKFGPKRVVYVSCNVHTQARDVGMLVQGFGGEWRYEIESLRGFDFFPQTGHVEGVCVLNRVSDWVASEGVKEQGDGKQP